MIQDKSVTIDGLNARYLEEGQGPVATGFAPFYPAVEKGHWSKA